MMDDQVDASEARCLGFAPRPGRDTDQREGGEGRHKGNIGDHMRGRKEGRE